MQPRHDLVTHRRMALKATIYKAKLQIADLDRGYYADHALTLARHPSETDERLLVRLAAFALNANDALAFGKGLSTDDEPDLWARDLTGAIDHWIDVGLPDERRVRKAAGRARQVTVYAYGDHNVQVWWDGARDAIGRLANARVIRLPGASTKALAGLAVRTMALSCTIQDGSLWLGDGEQTVEVMPEVLYAPSEGRSHPGRTRS